MLMLLIKVKFIDKESLWPNFTSCYFILSKLYIESKENLSKQN